MGLRQLPPAFMHESVVPIAEENLVRYIGGAALRPGLEVMYIAAWAVAPGTAALSALTGDHCRPSGRSYHPAIPPDIHHDGTRVDHDPAHGGVAGQPTHSGR